jgi:thioesterase domain-containing protein
LARQGEIDRQEALMPPALLTVKRSMQRAVKTYDLRPYTGPLTYLRATGDNVNIPFFRAWEKINRGSGDLIDMPGTHFTLMKPPLVNIVGAHLQRWLDRLQQTPLG